MRPLPVVCLLITLGFCIPVHITDINTPNLHPQDPVASAYTTHRTTTNQRATHSQPARGAPQNDSPSFNHPKTTNQTKPTTLSNPHASQQPIQPQRTPLKDVNPTTTRKPYKVTNIAHPSEISSSDPSNTFFAKAFFSFNPLGKPFRNPRLSSQQLNLNASKDLKTPVPSLSIHPFTAIAPLSPLFCCPFRPLRCSARALVLFTPSSPHAAVALPSHTTLHVSAQRLVPLICTACLAGIETLLFAKDLASGCEVIIKRSGDLLNSRRDTRADALHWSAGNKILFSKNCKAVALFDSNGNAFLLAYHLSGGANAAPFESRPALQSSAQAELPFEAQPFHTDYHVGFNNSLVGSPENDALDYNDLCKTIAEPDMHNFVAFPLRRVQSAEGEIFRVGREGVLVAMLKKMLCAAEVAIESLVEWREEAWRSIEDLEILKGSAGCFNNVEWSSRSENGGGEGAGIVETRVSCKSGGAEAAVACTMGVYTVRYVEYATAFLSGPAATSTAVVSPGSESGKKLIVCLLYLCEDFPVGERMSLFEAWKGYLRGRVTDCELRMLWESESLNDSLTKFFLQEPVKKPLLAIQAGPVGVSSSQAGVPTPVPPAGAADATAKAVEPVKISNPKICEEPARSEDLQRTALRGAAETRQAEEGTTTLGTQMNSALNAVKTAVGEVKRFVQGNGEEQKSDAPLEAPEGSPSRILVGLNGYPEEPGVSGTQLSDSNPVQPNLTNSDSNASLAQNKQVDYTQDSTGDNGSQDNNRGNGGSRSSISSGNSGCGGNNRSLSNNNDQPKSLKPTKDSSKPVNSNTKTPNANTNAHNTNSNTNGAPNPPNNNTSNTKRFFFCSVILITPLLLSLIYHIKSKIR